MTTKDKKDNPRRSLGAQPVQPDTPSGSSAGSARERADVEVVPTVPGTADRYPPLQDQVDKLYEDVAAIKNAIAMIARSMDRDDKRIAVLEKIREDSLMPFPAELFSGPAFRVPASKRPRPAVPSR